LTWNTAIPHRLISFIYLFALFGTTRNLEQNNAVKAFFKTEYNGQTEERWQLTLTFHYG